MPGNQCEYGISDEGKKQRILELKNRLQDAQLTQFPYDDEYLERFLGGTDFDVEKAFVRVSPIKHYVVLIRELPTHYFRIIDDYIEIKTYYELLLEYPEWFTKDPPLSKKELIEKDIRIVLPETDKEGRPIYVVKLGLVELMCNGNGKKIFYGTGIKNAFKAYPLLGTPKRVSSKCILYTRNVDVDTMTIQEVVAVDDVWLESILLNKKDHQKGLCVIIDIANFPWKQIKWVTPHNIKMGLKKLQCLPFKDYRFHIVNDAMMMHAAIKIVWPFLPEYIKNVVKFHFNDRAALHEFIDQEVLPTEYGGQKHRTNYTDLYDQLFSQNQQIAESFKIYRKV